jgi:hypothetical protein
MKLAVLEAEGEHIASVLSRIQNARVTGGEKARSAKALSADVLILSQKGAEQAAHRGKTLRCRTLVIPGHAAAVFPGDHRTVTYGMARTDDVTLSSVSDGVCVFALTREAVTAAGQTLERQEFPIGRPSGVSAENLMAAYAGALLADGLEVH